jgi:hypothetical protein
MGCWGPRGRDDGGEDGGGAGGSRGGMGCWGPRGRDDGGEGGGLLSSAPPRSTPRLHCLHVCAPAPTHTPARASRKLRLPLATPFPGPLFGPPPAHTCVHTRRMGGGGGGGGLEGGGGGWGEWVREGRMEPGLGVAGGLGGGRVGVGGHTGWGVADGLGGAGTKLLCGCWPLVVGTPPLRSPPTLAAHPLPPRSRPGTRPQADQDGVARGAGGLVERARRSTARPVPEARRSPPTPSRCPPA